MGRILIDTNVLIRFFRGDEPLSEQIERAEAVVVHPIVYAEYISGLNENTKGGRMLRKQIEAFLDAPSVTLAHMTLGAAVYYSKIYRYLKQMGKMIPQNDIWLAASALENGYGIATHDRHFGLIPMLNLMLSP